VVPTPSSVCRNARFCDVDCDVTRLRIGGIGRFSTIARRRSPFTRSSAKLLGFKSFAGTRDHRCSLSHALSGQFTRRRSQVRVLPRPPRKNQGPTSELYPTPRWIRRSDRHRRCSRINLLFHVLLFRRDHVAPRVPGGGRLLCTGHVSYVARSGLAADRCVEGQTHRIQSFRIRHSTGYPYFSPYPQVLARWPA